MPGPLGANPLNRTTAVRCLGRAEGRKTNRAAKPGRAIKKRLGLFSRRRLGSPPPELPNHEMDSRELLIRCKRHFGNRIFRSCEIVLNRQTSRSGFTQDSLLLAPALAIVAGGPDFSV